MERPPLVSVVIPAHNAAVTVAAALESVLRQDYAPLEILVVDDGSTDDTTQVLAAYYSRGVRRIALHRNHGAAEARNAGLRAAGGKFIAFLDADDRWLAHKLSRQAPLLERNPRLALITCDSIFLRPSGEVLRRGHEEHPPVAGPHAWRVLLAHNFIPTPTVVARRCDLLALGGFNTNLPVGEDLDLWIRLALRGEVAVVPEVLVEILDRPASLMKQYQDREWEIIWPMIRRHLDQQSAQLTTDDVRAIKGRRLFAAGAHLFDQRQYLESAAMFTQSLWQGFRTGKSLANIPRALLFAAIRSRR